MTLNEIEKGLAISRYFVSSEVVYKGPCIVKSVHIAGDGANGDCAIYDGIGTKGELKAHLEVLSGTSYNWVPGDGVLFRFGIYQIGNATTTKVTVTYIPLQVE